MATTPRSTRPPTSLLGLAAGAAVVAALVAFLAGRLTADAAPSKVEGRGASGGAAPTETAWASEPARRVVASPPRAAPGAEAPSAEPILVPQAVAGEIPAPGQSSAAVVAATAQAAVETKQQLEALRSDLLQKCWPSGGLPKGRTSARLTFSVAYDAHGREVARGVSEDRRAPTGELKRCISRQPLGTLRISPPGANVSVKVALNLP